MLHSDAFSWAGKCGSMGFERSSVFGGVIAINVFLIEFNRILERGYRCELPKR
jgi:hypothetical protein